MINTAIQNWIIYLLGFGIGWFLIYPIAKWVWFKAKNEAKNDG